MKKKIIIYSTIFSVLFLFIRPDKIIKGLFLYNDFLVTEIPKIYKIDDFDKDSFVYGSDYKNFYPILFFRNNISDYIIFKINYNEVSLKEEEMVIENSYDDISSSYKFKFGVVDFYLANATMKNSNITIVGNRINSTKLNNNYIFEIESNFEIFQNGKKIFYYQGFSNAKKFIIIKREKIPIFYIIESKGLTKEDIVSKFLI